MSLFEACKAAKKLGLFNFSYSLKLNTSRGPANEPGKLDKN